MRIAIIANGYPDKREPQWGCFECDQANALKNAGHQVSILYVDGRFRLYWRKIGLTHKSEDGIEIFGFFIIPMEPVIKISKRLRNKLMSWMYDRVYKKMHEQCGIPDVIYAHYLDNIYYGVKLKKKYQIPLVGIEHWSVLNQEELSHGVLLQGKIAYENTNRLLAVSKSLQTQIMKHFGIDSMVVYDMLGPEFIIPQVLKREVRDGFIFVAVGSLIQRKGFDVLISAFAKSNLASKRCRVIIVGDGPEKQRLVNQSNEFGISDYVSLVGRKTKEEIIKIMSECHAFILSSRAETFGVVCIEALSQGLPNIATVCGGPEEFITDKNGFLIPTDDIDAMAEAMCKMYENYCHYDNAAIANECLSKFSPQVIASQLTEIFNEVTK